VEVRLDEVVEVLLEPIQFLAPDVAGGLLGLHELFFGSVWHVSLVDQEYGTTLPRE